MDVIAGHGLSIAPLSWKAIAIHRKSRAAFYGRRFFVNPLFISSLDKHPLKPKSSAVDQLYGS